ncbi:CAP domain-containing protein [Arthrobacter sp. KBS0702]|uniref:CAP domain-containing protein n=1 Tax=Arthrobacter sp. KBS0702 TaxID=2578107 RepID=UPI0028F41B00|nr:CAP domain-containing protein [Arthrobacter sp. KBS0702]
MLKKFAVAALCALTLVSPAAVPMLPSAAPSSASSPAAAPAARPAATEPAVPAAAPAASVNAPTAPGRQDPAAGAPRASEAARQAPPAVAPPATSAPAANPAGAAPAGAAPAGTETAGTGVPAAAAPAGPPETPLIPPLSATDADLRAAAGRVQAAPEVSAQALVQDSNASQVLAVFNAINAYRSSLGLAPVKYNTTVAGMSQEWSNNIATREVIEHRASFWTDPRALNPTNGAGEVIAVSWTRDAAQLVEWWKSSPAHDAILRDPRFNVIGIGITFTDGNWQTTPNRYAMWGVVNFFGYSFLPAGTTTSPGAPIGAPVPVPSVCDPAVRHMPPTRDLSAAAIKSGSDLLSVNEYGQLLNSPSLGGRSYGAPVVIGGGFASALQVFLTDWDRDGVYDVLAQWSDGRVTLHAGLAAGGFRPAVTLGQSGWAGMTAAVGQWCSTNRLPQLMALDGSGNLWLYQNPGLGDLSQRTLVGTGIAATRLSMVDFDADGFQDLLALQANGDVLLYRGAGVPAPRSEARRVVASGWSDVTAVRSLRDVTGLNSTGLALRRGSDAVQYWDLSKGTLSSPSYLYGNWAGIRLAQ